MDAPKFRLFDLFAHILPGFVVILIVQLIYVDLDIEFKCFTDKAFSYGEDFKIYTFLFLVIISYVVGFIFHFIGKLYFKFFGKLIWKKQFDKIKTHSYIDDEEKLAIIKHHSEGNFIYIEIWYALRNMSFNLSLASLVLFIVLTLKIEYSLKNGIEWFIFTFSCLLSAIVLLKTSLYYHKLAHNLKYYVINTLKLLNTENKQQINIKFDNK